jgi:hypothetical protein
MPFNPFSVESNAASVGASVGAQLGSKAGPVGAGIGAGFGAAGGYIAGSLACPVKRVLPDGGEHVADEAPPAREPDGGERRDAARPSPPSRVEIPVTEE